MQRSGRRDRNGLPGEPFSGGQGEKHDSTAEQRPTEQRDTIGSGRSWSGLALQSFLVFVDGVVDYAEHRPAVGGR